MGYTYLCHTSQLLANKDRREKHTEREEAGNAHGNASPVFLLFIYRCSESMHDICLRGGLVVQGRRALLAEDNLINQKVAQMMLTSLGMAVEVANNGQEAVAKVLAREQEGQQFHVVLMDMAMPVMGGVEATKVAPRYDMLCMAYWKASLV